MTRFAPWAIVALLAMAFGQNPTSAQNLLDDGAFDLATSGGTVSGSAWSLVANSPDGSDLSARFQTGFANANNTGAGGTQAPGTGAGIWFRAFEGNQGGSGEPLADAVLTQSIVAPLSGDYQLDFVAGIEGIANFTAQDFSVTLASDGTGGSASADLIALAGGITDGNIGGAGSNNKGGTPFTLDLVGVTAGDMITVTGQMLGGTDSGSNPQSGFLDNFNLRAVPEPASVVMTLLAVAGGLAVVRRR